jgi:hypothetical protein
VALGSAHYGHGPSPIFLDDVTCIGNEKSIIDCPHRAWGANDCTHGEDVGISCTHGKFFLNKLFLNKTNLYNCI